VKNNELNYSLALKWIGDGYEKYVWIIFIPLVIFIIVAVSNGANLTDGLDGLATSTTAVIAGTLGILAWVSGNFVFADYLNIMYIPNSGELAIFISAMMGAAIGFLWYNSYPAQVFMGDTGSLALGGIIAVFAIIIRKELLIPLLCGVFLIENLSVIIQVSYFKYTKRKTGEGKRVFLMSPLHHHYQKKGYHEAKIVMRFFIVGIILAVLSIVTLKLSDNGSIKESYKTILSEHRIEFEENQHSIERILNADEIIKSPGIPDNIDLIKQIKAKNISIISDIEFAFRYSNAKTVCITGSNGKTTTASIIYHILKKNNKDVVLAGNIGNSYAMEVAKRDPEIFVLEISSFQLDYMFDFKADISILTNITPDHLDRYNNDFQQYANSKMRIIQNQTSNDAFIYNADDEEITNQLEQLNSKVKKYAFSQSKSIDDGAYRRNNEIVFNIKPDKFIMTIEELALQGRHNVYNSMAGGIASKLLEIRKEGIRNSLNDVGKIEHRLEYVATIKQVEFINDSKATNVNSTWFALESMNRPTVWIAGGVDKGNDYESLKPLVKEKVKAIVCLGVDNSKIKEAFGDLVETIIETNNAEDAVNTAFYLSERNDVVLLSPACASFDLYDDYQQRGNSFKRAVQDL
jgi:UDP-N-acetylmuramoylalanine--D-glutamate ligase